MIISYSHPTLATSPYSTSSWIRRCHQILSTSVVDLSSLKVHTVPQVSGAAVKLEQSMGAGTLPTVSLKQL